MNFYLNHKRYCILDELHFDTNFGESWEGKALSFVGKACVERVILSFKF